MTLEQFAYFADIIGSVVVIASLIYLSRQVRQGNLLAKSQARQRMMEHGQSELYLQMDDPELFRCFTKDGPLTTEEQVKLSHFLTCAMRQREWEWFQYRDGIIGKDVYEAYHGVISIHLGLPRTRRWWHAVGKTAFDPEFSAEVDALLDRTELTTYLNDIASYDKGPEQSS